MDRGAHQHAFAVLPRQLEHRVGHVIPSGAVQQAVLAPPGGDVQLLLTDPVVDRVANTPAALTTARASTSPLLVWTTQPPSRRSRPVTWVSKENSTPFLAADSAIPKVSSKGHTMPEVLASRAPATSSDRLH